MANDANGDDGEYRRFLHYKDMLVENHKNATALGNTAFRSSILLNGAAAIALLAFVSHQWSPRSGVPENVIPIVHAMQDLVIGAFSAVIATGFGYLRMFFESVYYPILIQGKGSGRWASWAANGSLFVAVVLFIYSYVRFGLAMKATAAALLGGG